VDGETSRSGQALKPIPDTKHEKQTQVFLVKHAKKASGAKAHHCFVAFTARLKSCPTLLATPLTFFRKL
jgi:hypothetical protein